MDNKSLPVNDKAVKQVRIIIVDDEPIVSILTEILQSESYQKLVATSRSQEVLEYYNQVTFKLLLLRFNMPEMDDFQVMHQFAYLHLDLPPPVLIITAKIAGVINGT